MNRRVNDRFAPEPLTIDRRADADILLVSVRGEVDMLSSPDLLTATRQAISESAGRVVVLDLTGVGFLDSHGLATLVTATDAALRQGTRLRVVIGPAQPVRRPIEISGLDGVLALYDTVADARSFQEQDVQPASRDNGADRGHHDEVGQVTEHAEPDDPGGEGAHQLDRMEQR